MSGAEVEMGLAWMVLGATAHILASCFTLNALRWSMLASVARFTIPGIVIAAAILTLLGDEYRPRHLEEALIGFILGGAVALVSGFLSLKATRQED